ncbi:MAG: hypothetical protein M1830_009126, partial [Pleopsidium flavum]
MATHEIDELLREVSTQMASSQLTRRSSGHSGRTSASLRREVARVMKTNSAGCSPRSVGRRKTTISQSAARHRSTLDDHYDNMLSLDGQQPNTQSRPQQYKRPISWHPSSLTPGNTVDQSRASETEGIQFPIQDSRGNQTLGINGLWTPSLFANLHATNPTASMAPPEANYMPYKLAESSEYDSYPSLPGSTAYPYGPLSVPDPAPYSASEVYEGIANLQYSSSIYPYQNWSGLPGAAAIDISAPPTPDFLPIQHPPLALAEPEYDRSTRLPKQPSRELVGMGLYDDPEDSSTLGLVGRPLQSLPRPQALAYTRHLSAGKGLKLEETWQPLPEENLEQADESYSSDGSDEELPQANAFQSTHQLPVPAASDLSNHTFYFESDDTFDGRMFFNDTMSAMDTKAQGVALDTFA